MVNGVVTLPHETVPSVLPPFTVQEIRKRVSMVQSVMREVMKENTHFGTIPGTPKPSLWKPGAEVLCLTFRLAPLLESRVVHDDPEIEWGYHQVKWDRVSEGTTIGYFEVEASCTVQSIDGQVLSRCSARCSNREGKYRGLGLFEVRNTVQKMAEKRAFVSAVLMATGASDIFTQDLEDFPELLEPAVPKVATPEPKPAPSVVKPGATLSPKREAWLFRAAQEANLPKEALDRCQEYLRVAAPEAVKGFFDDLAKRKKVFEPFLVAAA
jgi:hypothetical protein